MLVKLNAWEQRKLGDISSLITKGTTPLDKSGNGEVSFIKIENIDSDNGEIHSESKISIEEHNGYLKRSQLKENDILFSIAGTLGRVSVVKPSILPANTNQALAIIRTKEGDLNYLVTVLKGRAVSDYIRKNPTIGAQPNLSLEQVGNLEIPYPSFEEQEEIGEYFKNLDHLITLHQRKCKELKLIKKYMLQNMFIKEEHMPELESSIEKKLIEQLCYGASQWTYRSDLKTEQQLWDNFKYILEQNNKAKLNDTTLSDSEFAQIKNQLQFPSFYDAGKWLVGENGIVYVHVQRGNETLHLMVINHEHVSGGSSVYEVINQYQTMKENQDEYLLERDRRFDVSLLIHGLPLIHIELKNREHSYMEGFYQIKKYISEGKFRGIFSNVCSK